MRKNSFAVLGTQAGAEFDGNGMTNAELSAIAASAAAEEIARDVAESNKVLANLMKILENYNLIFGDNAKGDKDVNDFVRDLIGVKNVKNSELSSVVEALVDEKFGGYELDSELSEEIAEVLQNGGLEKLQKGDASHLVEKCGQYVGDWGIDPSSEEVQNFIKLIETNGSEQELQEAFQKATGMQCGKKEVFAAVQGVRDATAGAGAGFGIFGALGVLASLPGVEAQDQNGAQNGNRNPTTTGGPVVVTNSSTRGTPPTLRPTFVPSTNSTAAPNPTSNSTSTTISAAVTTTQGSTGSTTPAASTAAAASFTIPVAVVVVVVVAVAALAYGVYRYTKREGGVPAGNNLYHASHSDSLSPSPTTGRRDDQVSVMINNYVDSTSNRDHSSSRGVALQNPGVAFEHDV